MINYIVEQKIHVLDNADGIKQPCKVVQVDNDEKKILIRYIKWNKNFYEWILLDSSRITVEQLLMINLIHLRMRRMTVI